MSYAVSLLSLLRSRDEELYGRFLDIQEKAKPLLSYTQGKFPYYTPHDFFHSESVMENLNWIIPDKIKEDMNQHEIFLLLVAALLHDWGMVGKKDENPELIREEHHIRTENNFEHLYETVRISYFEALIAGRIAKGHRKVDLYSTEYDDKLLGNGIRIRQRFLSAILRVADETDITHSRTPEVIYFSINPSEKSEDEFRKHLSISGIGQLDEPHKIYITAIAKDPKGAEAIRKVSEKIQIELNIVKSILANNGISLDIVELKLETRGFIDKPIGFEVSSSRIVDLLIGKHLYGTMNVAIRELVQNAIDSCCTKKLKFGEYCAKIAIEKNSTTISILDNGIGMGFSEAKKFLSSVGDSIYSSEEYTALFQGKGSDPISKFGIGFLSSFLISDGLMVETKKANEDSCLFTISALGQPWKYEKGSMIESGTKITLKLNEYGKGIDIYQSLKQYFITTCVPVFYRNGNDEFKRYDDDDDIITKIFDRHLSKQREYGHTLKEAARADNEDFSAILISGDSYFSSQISLYNHDIYVNEFSVSYIDHNSYIFINIKRNLIDLHMSREDVIKNEKWDNLLCQVLKSLLTELRHNSSNDEYIDFFNRLVGHTRIFTKGIDISVPNIRFYFDNSLFPSIVQNVSNFILFDDVLKLKQICLIRCAVSTYSDILQIISSEASKENYIICPYSLPLIGDMDDEKDNLLKYLCLCNGITYTEKDLRKILVENATISEIDYSSFCPSNVKFADFGKFKPIVVKYIEPCAVEDEEELDSSFWVCKEYIWRLLDSDRRKKYESVTIYRYGEGENSINIVEEYVVLIDRTDQFIEQILVRANQFSEAQTELVNRYLQYLSIMPYISTYGGNEIYVEIIDSLERDIAKSFLIERPEPVYDRMSPNCGVYLHNMHSYVF